MGGTPTLVSGFCALIINIVLRIEWQKNWWHKWLPHGSGFSNFETNYL